MEALFNVDGAIHAMGNGRFLIYARGGDITHVFGPPYTTASLMGGAWCLSDGTAPDFASSREPGTAIWTHHFLRAGTPTGTAQAFVLPDMPVYLCRLHLDEACTFTLDLPDGRHAQAAAAPSLPTHTAFAWIDAPDTARLLFYVMGQPLVGAIAAWGDATVTITQTDDTITLHFPPGESTLAIIGGPGYPDVAAHCRLIAGRSFDDHLAAARAADLRLTGDLRLPATADGHDPALVNAVIQRCEDVAFLTTTQQSEDGGVMAGYPYPLAYVRDQYGVYRGLMALGLYQEARRNILFRWGKWQRFGNLRNAESMGHERIRHMHENDDVEMTAYTILQVLEYIDATGERDLLPQVFPMLDWCWRVQATHLRDGMLPFNGDETYVAGGILPRSALNDGSMEATLLYLEAGKRLIPLARQFGLWAADEADAQQRQWAEVQSHFRRNFVRGGRLITNAPERAALPGMPQYRHGVCESCHSFRWLGRSANRRYVCHRCADSADLPPVDDPPQTIYAAGLLPSFIHSTYADNTAEIIQAAQIFQQTGEIPITAGRDQAVGYDMGLLLYGLTISHHPAAPAVADYVLARADSTGSWSEYYRGATHAGTRCRPWESCINITALLRYIGTAVQLMD